MQPLLPRVTKLSEKILSTFGGIDKREGAKENCFEEIIGFENKDGTVMESYDGFPVAENGFSIYGDDVIVLENENGTADCFYIGSGGFYKNGELLPFNLSDVNYADRSWIANYVDDISAGANGKIGWGGEYEHTKLIRYGKYIFAIPQMIMTDGEKTYKWDRTAVLLLNTSHFSTAYGSISFFATEEWRKEHCEGFEVGDIVELFSNGKKIEGKFTVSLNENGQMTLTAQTEEGSNLSSSAFGTVSGSNCFVVRHKDVPAFTDATVVYNRMWGVLGNRIYASKLANPFAFKESDGTSSDAWWADTEDSNDFTAVSSLNGRVVAFKKTATYEIYGTVAPYTVKDVSRSLGCIDKKSLKEVNGVLFLLTTEGINVYGGSKFVNINDELGFFAENACGMGQGSKYYALIDGLVYKYNYYSGYWTCVTDYPLKRLLEVSGEVFGLTSGGELIQLTGDNLPFLSYNGKTVQTWSLTSVLIGGKDFYAEGINRLELRFEGGGGGNIKVEVSRDYGEFEKYTQSEVNEGWQIFTVPIYLKPCSTFKYRISGNGKLKLRLIKYCYRKGGNANKYEPA